jgi:c-di-GMP-binding flagellar brake protein YcgR
LPGRPTASGLYCTRVLVEHTATESVPLLRVRVVGAWARSQRREAVRIPVAIRPRIAAKLTGNARKPLRLGVINLSAGGVQVRSQDELRVGDRLALALPLMGFEEELEVEARVKRVAQHTRDGVTSKLWDAGCEFEGLAHRTSERIVQFIFAEQRAQARLRRARA